MSQRGTSPAGKNRRPAKKSNRSTKSTKRPKRKPPAPKVRRQAPSSLASPRKEPASPKPAKSRAQNRRRPAPKPPKPASFERGWRQRWSASGGRLRTWVADKRPALRRLGQVALLGVGVWASVWVGRRTVDYARTSPAFAIEEVSIEGAVALEAIDVRRAAGLQIGSNIFEVSLEDARNRLLQHPWVKEAMVVRKLPSRIGISLVERTPVALVALDQLYLVSEEGVVFKRLGVDDPADLPVITGIASERFYDDFDYRTGVLLRSMALLHDYEGAGLADIEPVSEIHFQEATGIELYVGDDGMHVRLGHGQHRHKLRRLRRVLERLSREKARPSYVYLDNARSPERVTVRLE